jgi:putative iron-dependent peroxidase
MMATNLAQPGVLGPLPAVRRTLIFHPRSGTDCMANLRCLRDAYDPVSDVLGIGEPLLDSTDKSIPSLRSFPLLAGASTAVASTQAALCLLVNGESRGSIFERSQRLLAALEASFELEDVIDTFKYDSGRDLTGYEDGTENPTGDDAVAAALVAEGGGMAGSSFVAVQRWVHDLRGFAAFGNVRGDAMIGRCRDSNEEIEEAPATAHVKRTAQEDYDPPAFMVRRSLPWDSGREQGLEFVTYVNSLDRFEVMMRRMAGLDDGIVDALFQFSRPVSGGYYWCPPLLKNRLDLSALGL